jgi:Transcriptional regulator
MKTIEIIDMIDMEKFDLNLLLALDALLEEKSVSRAAKRMGLGQPAMSYNLARLRKLLGDELLVRFQGGMVPTAKAEGMRPQLRQILDQIRNFVGQEAVFSPAEAQLEFRLGVTDSAEAILVPSVIAALVDQAPGIKLRLIPLNGGHAEEGLDSGECDLAVGVFSGGRNHHKLRVIYREDFCTIYNPELIRISGELTLDDFGSNPLLVIDGNGSDELLTALQNRGIIPHVAAHTPHLLAAPLIVHRAPLLATIHAQVAKLFANSYNLAVMPVPVDLKMDQARLVLMWHAANDNVAAHRWMRELVAATLQKMRQSTLPASK